MILSKLIRPKISILGLAVTLLCSFSSGSFTSLEPAGDPLQLALGRRIITPLEHRMFLDWNSVANSSDNVGRIKQIRHGLDNIVKLIDGLDFAKAPGKITVIVDKESAYAFVLDNRTERVISASPVCVGSLHNNIRNYMSSGAGVHSFYQYYPCGGSSPYGRGALRFHPSTYVTGSDCFIAMHGTNQEDWILRSVCARERYLTHGCIRLLDRFLVPLIDAYNKGELETLIILPYNNPSLKLASNSYTRMYFSKWKNMKGDPGGISVYDIINQLTQEWR